MKGDGEERAAGRVVRDPARDLRERRARREAEGADRVPVLASATIHGVAFVLVWLTTLTDPRPMPVETYQIEIVSAPSAAPVQDPDPPAPAEELVVETPDPEIPEPEDPTPLTEEPEPESEELTTETPETSPPPEEAPAEEETPAADPEPEEVETSGEDINVRMEGLRRDYPAYYGNIIRQMDRCFRWRQGGRWEAVVTFVIRSDGTISDLDLVQGSGNMAFDTQALGAVECAGQGRLGPLPDELPYDQLPVQFRFSPPN